MSYWHHPSLVKSGPPGGWTWRVMPIPKDMKRMAGRSIWRYRDWVIKAFNNDMPFDQFTTEQLAGDLLENPTDDQLIATAFHRNTMNNDEGGTTDEEFRVAALIDRVSTTWEVWQSTTMAVCSMSYTSL